MPTPTPRLDLTLASTAPTDTLSHASPQRFRGRWEGENKACSLVAPRSPALSRAALVTCPSREMRGSDAIRLLYITNHSCD